MLKKGHKLPVHPPSIFSLPTSYQRQTVSSKPRNVEARNVDSESCRHSGVLRNPEPDPDSIVSWDELKEYCLRLETDVVQKDDRTLLTEISGDPPIVPFSLTVFSDLSISCYKGSTKISYRDLINGFMYKVE